MAAELTAADFAEAIGVPVSDLATLERAGLPFVNKKKEGRAYPVPKALRWYVDHAITTRVGGIPARTTQRELAALTGYVPRQISNLVDEGKVKTVVEGGKRLYPLPQAVIEILAHRESIAKGKTGEKMTALDEAKLRKMESEAQSSELDLMVRRGELLDRVLVERALSELLQSLKAQLIQFAPRYEADLVGLDSRLKVRAILKPAVNAEIQRLSSAAAQVGRRIQMIDATADADDETAEEADGLRDAS